MTRSALPRLKLVAGLLAIGLFGGFAGHCQAQGINQTPVQGQATRGFITPVGGLLSNPVNYKRYSQITGVGPISGTVRIYNMFGVLYMQSAFGGAFGASTFGAVGGGGGFGGFGGGNTAAMQSNTSQGLVGSGLLPGIGATLQGDDPPQGVLLHVNYANLMFALQTQINTNNALNAKGPPGGIATAGGSAFGNGGFGITGNGGHGL